MAISLQRLIGTLLTCALFLACVGTSQATIIADWQFDAGAGFLNDSSGNGYNLTGGAASINDGGKDVASFTGSEILSTTTPVLLSTYRHLRLSYSIKYTGGGAGVIFETSNDFNGSSGAIFVDVSENSLAVPSPSGQAGIRFPADYNLDAYEHDALGGSAVYEDFVVEYNLDAATAAEIVQVWRDGVLQPDAAAWGLHGSVPGGFNFSNLYNANIGNRAAGGGVGYVGTIDYMTLEAVPEPASATLLALGSAIFVGLVRRRRR